MHGLPPGAAPIRCSSFFLGRPVRSPGEPVRNDVLSADGDLWPRRLRDKHLAPELERRVEEASGMPEEEPALHDRSVLGKRITVGIIRSTHFAAVLYSSSKLGLHGCVKKHAQAHNHQVAARASLCRSLILAQRSNTPAQPCHRVRVESLSPSARCRGHGSCRSRSPECHRRDYPSHSPRTH